MKCLVLAAVAVVLSPAAALAQSAGGGTCDPSHREQRTALTDWAGQHP